MDAITQWFLSNTPYASGVAIYESLPCFNKVLLANFKKKESNLLHEKLKYELQKYLQQITPGPVLVRSVSDKPSLSFSKVATAVFIQKIAVDLEVTSKKQAVYFHQLPVELRSVLLKANLLFKEICLLKVDLNELPGSAEKQALTIQISISQKQKENASCWRKIDYWQEFKTSPPAEAQSFLSLAPAELLRKEQYLFAAISKLNKRLSDNRKQIKTAELLKDHNRLSRAIEKQEGNLIRKTDELLKIKRLISGE